MKTHFLIALLATTSMLGSPALAQSSDIRQAEQDRQAQRQRERNERPQYLPGDRRIVEETQRREESRRRRGGEPPSVRDGRPAWQPDPNRRDERARAYERDYRRDEWRHDGRGAGPSHDWHRGGHLPRNYRGRDYVVDDWRSHRLYAPPRGHHWVQAGGDYVLVAIATGVIAAVLLNQ